VVSLRADLLDAHWLGKEIDEEFIDEMERRGVDICGEGGEFHSLVIDGPLFRKRMVIRNARDIRRKGISFLDQLNFELKERERLS